MATPPAPLWLLCATTAEAQVAAAAVAPLGPRCAVLRLGMGAERAAAGLRAALTRRRHAGLSPPAAVISFGLAASCDDSLPRGHWATATCLRQHIGDGDGDDDGPSGAAPAVVQPPCSLAALAGAAAAGRCHRRPWRQVAVPTDVRQLPGPWVLDMESYAWATIAHQQQLPWGVMRLISDAPATPLPAPLLAWGRGHRAAAVLAAAAAPATAWRFGRAMWQLRRALAAGAHAVALHQLQLG